jgi:hypothetical protein
LTSRRDVGRYVQLMLRNALDVDLAAGISGQLHPKGAT